MTTKIESSSLGEEPREKSSMPALSPFYDEVLASVNHLLDDDQVKREYLEAVGFHISSDVKKLNCVKAFLLKQTHVLNKSGKEKITNISDYLRFKALLSIPNLTIGITPQTTQTIKFYNNFLLNYFYTQGLSSGFSLPEDNVNPDTLLLIIRSIVNDLVYGKEKIMALGKEKEFQSISKILKSIRGDLLHDQSMNIKYQKILSMYYEANQLINFDVYLELCSMIDNGDIDLGISDEIKQLIIDVRRKT